MGTLEVEGIVSGYGKNEILHGVSLNVHGSETVGVIGPNGSGKSTLLKTMYGYLKPNRGRVIFDGEDITGLRPDQILRKGIAYVPQNRSVFPYMTVEENILMGGYVLKDNNEVKRGKEKIYERFPVLEERRKQKGGTLSGGEQRMLELSRALMVSPKLMMLDEPSLGLAPKIIEQTYTVINEIGSMGISLLIVEQNVQSVLKAAGRTYVINAGMNAFSGPSEAISSNEDLRRLYLGD